MRAWLFFLVLGSTIAVNALADDVDYLHDIQPLLSEKCNACHGALKQEAGLRLDAGSLIRKGGSDGPVLSLKDASQSLIIDRVSDPDPDGRMPPDGLGEPLSPIQIELLKTWIDQGAISPEDETIPLDPLEHWAYQTPRKEMPKTFLKETFSNPVDNFIRTEQRALGLLSVETADRFTLLRRAHFDLIGLPPTRKQLQDFLNDDSPDALSKAIDKLLASPHYGERWARHWMDVWRYSDWDGYKDELRGSQRHIWRWRDWIINSLNADKPYDQMIVEMLAADEVAPSNPDSLAATGFLARNFHVSNRNIWLDATVEHTAKAFLGMTLNCARCHDHKFDPISQQMYYEFRAIFEPHQVRTDQIPNQPDIKLDGLPRAYDAELAAKTFVFAGGDDKHPIKDLAIAPAPPRFLAGDFQIQPVILPVDSYRPALRDFVVSERRAHLKKQLDDAERKLKETAVAQTDSLLTLNYSAITLEYAVAQLQLGSFESRLAAEQAKLNHDKDESKFNAMAIAAANSERTLNAKLAELAYVQKEVALESIKTAEQADEAKKTQSIKQATKELADTKIKLLASRTELQKNDANFSPIGEVYPESSTGRRLALARWVASKNNPLTARVAINQIWMRHFGEPLVENPFDFGLRSPQPRHAKLLDWLAVELMENNWNMKHIHRLILTSQTWQQVSSSDSPEVAENRLIDPDNHYLWRMNAQRLDAEIIRDSVLAVAGQLENKFGGPDIDFRKGEVSRRRSVYLRHAYEKQMKMLLLFDTANPNECYRRSESIIPQQALALVNSTLSLDQSRLIARQLWTETSGQETEQTEFVNAAFQQLLSRNPDPMETESCLKFLSDQTELLSHTENLTEFQGGQPANIKPDSEPDARARENLIQVLLNHNDFVTVR